jgi:hypothetical protein
MELGKNKKAKTKTRKEQVMKEINKEKLKNELFAHLEIINKFLRNNPHRVFFR